MVMGSNPAEIWSTRYFHSIAKGYKCNERIIQFTGEIGVGVKVKCVSPTAVAIDIYSLFIRGE